MNTAALHGTWLEVDHSEFASLLELAGKLISEYGSKADMEVYSIINLFESQSMNALSALECARERDKLYILLNEWRNGENAIKPHSHWVEGDVHIRFLCASIRIAQYLYEKELDDDKYLSNLVATLLDYSIVGRYGRWFLHDSLELTCLRLYPYTVVDKANSDDLECTYALNTHVDALVTLINLPRSIKNKLCIDEVVIEAMRSLTNLLSAPPNNDMFHRAEEILRSAIYKSTCRNSKLVRILRGRLNRLYIRCQRYNMQKPAISLTYDSGYISRDVNVVNISFVYHAVNLYDLSRLCLSVSSDSRCRSEYDMLWRRMRSGIMYAVHSGYSNYLLCSAKTANSINMLTEAMLISALLKEDLDISRSLIALLRLTRNIPKTHLYFGVDLAVGVFVNNIRVAPEEIVCISDGRKSLYVNYSCRTVTVNASCKNGRETEIKLEAGKVLRVELE